MTWRAHVSTKGFLTPSPHKEVGVGENPPFDLTNLFKASISRKIELKAPIKSLHWYNIPKRDIFAWWTCRGSSALKRHTRVHSKQSHCLDSHFKSRVRERARFGWVRGIMLKNGEVLTQFVLKLKFKWSVLLVWVKIMNESFIIFRRKQEILCYSFDYMDIKI